MQNLLLDLNILTKNKMQKLLPNKTSNFYILIILLALNILLKFWFIDSISIGHDEPLSVRIASNSLFDILFVTDNNPPLFYMMLYYMINWFGSDIFSIRFIPCVFGILLSCLIYLFGKKHLNQKIGFVAALLCTFSTVYHHHSHNARVYTIFAFLAVLSMHYFLEYINQKEARKQHLIFLTITNIVLIYTHFFGFLLLGFQAITFLILSKKQKEKIISYFKSLILIGITFIPYVYLLYLKFTKTVSIPSVIPETSLESLYIITAQFSNQPVVAVFFILLNSILIFFFISGKVKFELNEKIIFFWFWGIFIFTFLVSFFVPMFISRYMVFIFVAFYYLLAIVIKYLFKEKKNINLAYLIMVGMMFFTFQPTYHFYGLRRGTEDFLIQYLFNVF